MRSIGLSTFAFGAFTWLLLAGCSSVSSGATQSDSGPPGSAGGSSGTGGSLGTGGSPGTGGNTAAGAVDCAPVIQCLSACPTPACEDDCMTNTTPATAQLVTAFALCVQANACTGADCLQTYCSSELAACGLTTTDAGAVVPGDDAGTVADDASTVVPNHDAGTAAPDSAADVGSGTGGSITVNGRCENAAGMGQPGACWDFAYVVSGTNNTFVEKYFYYAALLAPSGHTTCTDDNNQTFTASAGGTPMTAQNMASTILANKRRACDALGGTFTEGAAECGAAGSLGHCTETGANVYDAASDSVTMHKTTTWATP